MIMPIKMMLAGAATVGAALLLVFAGGKRVNDRQEAVAKALAKHDRPALEKLAAELDAAGYRDAAASLRRETDSLGPSGTGQAVQVVAKTPEDPGRAAATALVDHLKNNARGHENRELVRQFQAREKLHQDGRFGPGTATRILQRYGVVPPPPYYWAKGKNGELQKAAFKKFVQTYLTSDPERTAQFERLLKDTEVS